MSLLRPLMAGVLLLAVSSTALGPPNGTVGIIDFRYPDYIVEPLVDCPFEGYFPHPRDNNWFYRCYDRFGTFFFWRAYFQCPPCTVFSDALDQCVFRETGTQCLPPAEPCQRTFEDCRLVRICPATNSNRAVHAAVEVCFKTTLHCSGQPDRPLCQDGYVYDRTNNKCRVGKPNLPCLHDAPSASSPIYTSTPPLTTSTSEARPPSTITSPVPTPLPNTTANAPATLPATNERPPPDTHGNFVCEMAGSRPNAEGFPTLGCSERQFCDHNRLPLAPIIGCQLFLECDFTGSGGLQLVHKQCPAGQFFFYGNVNQCGGQGQLGWYDCPASTDAPTKLPPTAESSPTPPATIITPPTSNTDHASTGNNETFGKVLCELAGSRPNAEGDRTLGCSERQFCDRYGNPLAPIIGCQLFLECDFTASGGLQLVHKQCPAGQFFFYGNVNQCGGQGQLELFECLQSTTTTNTTTTITQVPSTAQAPPTTITPPAPTPLGPSFSSKDCTFHGETLGVPEHEVSTYCRRACGDSDEGSYRYCSQFRQCFRNQDTAVFDLELSECQRSGWFDREHSTCVQITSSSDCIQLKNSTSPSEKCTYNGQLPVNLNRTEHPELPCHNKTKCSDGSPSVSGCRTFYQCMNLKMSSKIIIERGECAHPAMQFDNKTRRCVFPPDNECRSNLTSANAMRQTAALFTPHTSVRFNQVNPSQTAPQLPYTSAQDHVVAPFQHPVGSPPHSTIGQRVERPIPASHLNPFRYNVLGPALFGPKNHKSLNQVNMVGRISSPLPGFGRPGSVGFAQTNMI